MLKLRSFEAFGSGCQCKQPCDRDGWQQTNHLRVLVNDEPSCWSSLSRSCKGAKEISVAKRALICKDQPVGLEKTSFFQCMKTSSPVIFEYWRCRLSWVWCTACSPGCGELPWCWEEARWRRISVHVSRLRKRFGWDQIDNEVDFFICHVPRRYPDREWHI